jgi:pimeloyl-ACP methyl ester carboxylesterase
MEPVARIPFRIDTPRGRLRGDLRLPPRGPGPAEGTAPSGAGPAAAIVVCHGFKGFKDWGFFPSACERLATAVGCPVASVNLTGSGVGADLGRFGEPEAFATNTFSREVADLEAVLDGLATGRLGEAAVTPVSRIALLGHSRGAVAVTVVGARRPEVRVICTWAGLADPGRYEALFTPTAEARGWAEIRNARTGEVLRLRRDVVDDYQAAGDRLDPLRALPGRGAPLLAVHGEEDEAVPISDSRALAGAADDAELLLLPGTGHTFDARHPWVGSTPALERALAATARFCRARLSEEA